MGATAGRLINGRGGSDQLRYIGADAVTIDLGTAATGLGDFSSAITRSSGGGSAANERTISDADWNLLQVDNLTR